MNKKTTQIPISSEILMQMPISIAAEILSVHQRTLRIYDAEGLLKPIRSPKNRRYYTEELIKRGRVIKFLTDEIGMSLLGVKLYLHNLHKYHPNLNIDTYRTFITEDLKEINVDLKQLGINREKAKRKGRKKNITMQDESIYSAR